MLESKFQSELKKKIETRFPGCLILKNDPHSIQGFPDLMILYHNKWATLETKRGLDAEHQPNQDYYVSLCDYMSFSRFVNPLNVEEVLYEMEQAFRT